MNFETPLLRGTILRRYKRFLCDILPDNASEPITVHCPNSGSMKGIPSSDAPAMYSRAPNPDRKLPYTLEMIYNGTVWIGVNTHRTNKIAEEGIVSGKISQLSPFISLHREVKCSENSRIDLMLTQNSGDCYIEVKNVSLVEHNYALFPDAITQRGQKHLRELISLKQQGYRAAMLYIIQRSDCDEFSPAWEIDPVYAQGLLDAISAGVEAYAYQAHVTPEHIGVIRQLPFVKKIS